MLLHIFIYDILLYSHCVNMHLYHFFSYIYIHISHVYTIHVCITYICFSFMHLMHIFPFTLTISFHIHVVIFICMHHKYICPYLPYIHTSSIHTLHTYAIHFTMGQYSYCQSILDVSLKCIIYYHYLLFISVTCIPI